MNQTQERLADQIRKMEADLKEKKARASKLNRQERTGQLVSLGILFERYCIHLPPNEKVRWNQWSLELDERNKKRVQAAFHRIAAEQKKDKEQDQENTAGNTHPLG